MSVKKVANKQARQTQQKMVDFNTAVKRFWTKYVEFDSVAQRSEYWFVVLFLFLVGFVFNVLMKLIPFVGFLYWVWLLATVIPWLSLSARRLHDAGFSAKWLLALWGCTLLWFFMFPLVLLPFVAGLGVFLFVVTLLPSKFQNNPYRK